LDPSEPLDSVVVNNQSLESQSITVRYAYPLGSGTTPCDRAAHTEFQPSPKLSYISKVYISSSSSHIIEYDMDIMSIEYDMDIMSIEYDMDIMSIEYDMDIMSIEYDMDIIPMDME